MYLVRRPLPQPLNRVLLPIVVMCVQARRPHVCTLYQDRRPTAAFFCFVYVCLASSLQRCNRQLVSAAHPWIEMTQIFIWNKHGVDDVIVDHQGSIYRESILHTRLSLRVARIYIVKSPDALRHRSRMYT